MEGGPHGLALDEPFSAFPVGSQINVLAFVQVVTPGESLCVTVGRSQPFLTDADLDPHKPTVTILAGKICQRNGNTWILTQANGRVLQHSHPTHRDFDIMVEGCAGIGVVTNGFAATGTNTVAMVEQNPNFADWLRTTGHEHVIQMNLQSNEAIAAVADQLNGRGHVLGAGVACQPFSVFGDRKEQHDERAVSMPAALRLGFFTRATALVLECTKEAKDSGWVQSLIKEFQKATNYNMRQTLLDLHHTFPAKRQRWWCILVHPAFPIHDIPDMPGHRFDPSIMHVIPRPLQISGQQQQELELDDYEIEVFGRSRGGLTKFMINTWQPLPTATHSWGSQLSGCPCQCRQYGFSTQRIQERGIHAVIMPSSSTVVAGVETTVFRHISAQEVAVLNGLSPTYVDAEAKKRAKLTLAGTGQMASPLQGAWVLGHIKYWAQQVYSNVQTEHPRRTLANLCRAVLHDSTHFWGNEPTVSMQLFAYEVDAMDHPKIFPSEADRDRAMQTRILQVTGSTDCSSGDDESRQAGTVISPRTMTGGVGGFEAPPLATVHSRTIIPHHAHSRTHQHEAANMMDDTAQAEALHHSRTITADHAHSRNTHPAHTADLAAADQASAVDHSRTLHHDAHSRSSHPLMALAPAHLSTLQDSAEDHSRTASPNRHEAPTIHSSHLHPHDADTTHDPSRDSHMGHLRPEASQAAAAENNMHEQRPPMMHFEDSSQDSFDVEIVEFFASQRPESPKRRRLANNHMATETEEENAEPTSPQAEEDVYQVNTTHMCWIITPQTTPMAVTLQPAATVGQVCVAEASVSKTPVNEIKATSLIGIPLPSTQNIGTNQVIALRFAPDNDNDACPAKHHDQHVPMLYPEPRGTNVWQQRGWVADDEMCFYLQQLQAESQVPTTQPLIITSEEQHHIEFEEWFGDLLEQALAAEHPTKVFSTILMDHHWFPVSFEFSTEATIAATTPDMQTTLQTWLEQIVGIDDIEVQGYVVANQFPVDCGFQAVAWIESRSQNHPTITCKTSEQAEDMRMEFISHLQSTGADQIVRVPALGGAKADTGLVNALQDLVSQHGVGEERSKSCAQHLLQTLGHQQVKAALGSPRPWADLKQLATQHSIKIVAAAELKDAINKRVQAGLPFGRKENKRKERPKQPALRLSPEQVAIPDTVFQVDGMPIPQITQHQLQSTDRGLLVMSVEDALPFLQLTSPMQKTAVAIIVLDHQDDRLPPRKEIIKFPANCVATNEAMLVTAAMFQVGQKKAERSRHGSSVRIEETELVVIRAQVFKDQTQFDWGTFCQQPVKTLLGEPEFTDHRDAIHDVWDRQFLSLRYQKSKPADSDIFLVTLRATKPAAAVITQSNARDGKYYEPRMPNGRKPDENYEVIWLPRKTLGETLLLKQTSTHPADIARSGGRYGLRVLRAHAKATHEQHRSDLEYIPSDDMQMFRIGPLPFGTTRASLCKVFKEWSWPARPGQPVGQDQQHTGTYWTAMSNQNPSHWVFHCEHGDILISRIPTKKDPKPANAMMSANVEASRLTIQHLAGAKTSDTEPKSDPWAKDDPWAQGHAKSHSVSSHQMAAIEASVEKRVLAAIQPKVFRMDDDEDMPPAYDQKMAALEQQVQSLQTNMEQLQSGVQQFQHEQAIQNKQVSTQIGNVQKQVEAQHQGYQNLLDRKMAEQMERIEALFSDSRKCAKFGPSME
eukprot:Skav232542  [mRNA]  locus=scaffold319:262177:267237:+ [translate_table: standard]